MLCNCLHSFRSNEGSQDDGGNVQVKTNRWIKGGSVRGFDWTLPGDSVCVGLSRWIARKKGYTINFLIIYILSRLDVSAVLVLCHRNYSTLAQSTFEQLFKMRWDVMLYRWLGSQKGNRSWTPSKETSPRRQVLLSFFVKIRIGSVVTHCPLSDNVPNSGCGYKNEWSEKDIMK